MRWLQHLSGVKRMKVRVVVAEALSRGVQDFCEPIRAGRVQTVRRQACESGVQLFDRD
jgi:hypothetical protein